jgi:hypothetical protein
LRFRRPAIFPSANQCFSELSNFRQYGLNLDIDLPRHNILATVAVLVVARSCSFAVRDAHWRAGLDRRWAKARGS